MRTYGDIRTSRRLAWLLSATTLLLAAMPSTTSADTCDGAEQTLEPYVLCGETAIVGDETVVAHVRLAEPARLHALVEPGGGIEIEGDGRFVGVVLTVDAPSRNGELILAGKTSPEYDSRVRTASFRIEQDADGRYNLPPGDYLLYLLADGAPVSVTLHLEGLEGTTTIAPEGAVPYDIHEPDWNNYTAPVASGFAAVDEQTVGQRSLAGRFLWVEPGVHIASVSGLCFWDGPPPGSASTQPLCPDATFENRATPPPGNTGYYLSGVTDGLIAGDYGQGAYVQTLSVPDAGALRLLTFWLELGA